MAGPGTGQRLARPGSLYGVVPGPFAPGPRLPEPARSRRQVPAWPSGAVRLVVGGWRVGHGLMLEAARLNLSIPAPLNGSSGKSGSLGRGRCQVGGVPCGDAGDPRRRGAGGRSSRPSRAPPPERSPPRSRTAGPSGPASAAPSTTARSGSDRRPTSAGRRTPSAGAPA